MRNFAAQPSSKGSEFAEALNDCGRRRQGTLFGISFDMSDWFAHPLDNLPQGIMYDFEGASGSTRPLSPGTGEILRDIAPVPYPEYQKAFDEVIRHLIRGNAYMLNLAFTAGISSSLSLREIFHAARARFKLLIDDHFVCFSPERFVRIDGGCIKTYPIKGTIDTAVPGAADIIMNDPKEKAEHTMVVDLLRNDLGIVGRDVKVEKFRYLTEIPAGGRRLLQVTSEISARLPENWQNNLGHTITALLPAGSVSGTPKSSACRIIGEVEPVPRGYFCGIAGVFDGENLDSCVLIRFIEKKDGRLIYRSGGGITIDSNPEREHQELIEKIYVPTN